MIEQGKKYLQQGLNLAERELDNEETITNVLDIQFEAAQNQRYGFDGQHNQTALQPQYETLTHPDGTYYIAWKSVKKGATGQVVAIAGNEDTDTIQTTYTFKTADGLPVNATQLPGNDKYELNLSNTATVGESYIEAWKTIPARDSAQSTTEQLAGRLNIAIYEGQAFTATGK